MWWIPVVIFLGLGVFIVVAIEARERSKNKTASNTPIQPNNVPISAGECCGQHAVCEKELLLNQRDEIIYYDDEELDALSGISPDEYTVQQRQTIEDVFYTLQDKDVAGWLRSLQLRDIALPTDLRDEALLIVSERRGMK